MYLRRLSSLALIALAPAAAVAVGASPAAADVPATLYVNNGVNARCSDSGAGTSTQPFCTIAAGVAAVQPGQTLQLAGTFDEHVTVDKSGTPTAPITIAGGTVSGPNNGLTIDGQHDITVQSFRALNVAAGPAIAISHASSIRLTNVVASMTPTATAPAVTLSAVTNSTLTYPGVKGSGTGKGLTLDAATHNIVVDHGTLIAGSPGTTAIDIGGSNNTVTGSSVTGGSVAGIAVEPDADAVVIVNTHVNDGAGVGIRNDSAGGTDVINNEVKGNCGTGIRIAGTSDSVWVENNLVNGNGVARSGCTPPSDAVNIGVYDAAVGHATIDYNNVHEDSAPADYAWPSPMTLAQFRAASGQGAHDVESADPAAAVDSANSSAPAWPSADYAGRGRVNDPNISDTGTGIVTDADRGPSELGTGPLPVLEVGVISGLTVGVGVNGSTTGYGSLTKYVIDYGDGTSPATATTYPIQGFSHTYAKPGLYTVTFTLTDSNALTVSTAAQVWPTQTVRSVQMLAVNDRYVVAGNSGTAPLIATATGQDMWGYFDIDDLGNGYVALYSSDSAGKYVVVDQGRSGQLDLSGTALSDAAQFQLVTNPDGSFSFRSKLNGNYVTAESAGTQPLIADRTAIGAWEQFRFVDLNQTDRSLNAAANGQYVTAEQAGTQPLIANRALAGPWEKFDLIDAGQGYVALYSRADSKFVTAENAGTLPLIANRTAIGAWEQFTLVHNPNGTVSLLARANSKYVTAESAGNQPLIANRTAVGPWEQFTLN